MSTAILTIDDISSANTPAMVDYLCEKGIRAVMFAEGKHVEKYYAESLYAVRKGIIVGNHSYSHIHFSDAPYEECAAEIEKTEVILDRLYRDAGVPRQYRPFRFPYGDRGLKRGQEHADALQRYLRERGFSKLADDRIQFPWYRHSFADTFWTFDFAEYRMQWDRNFTEEDVYRRIHDANPELGGALLEEGSHHIVLLHDHPETEAIVPRYYAKFLDCCMAAGVEFLQPEFAAETP